MTAPAASPPRKPRTLRKARIGTRVVIALPDKGDEVPAMALRHGRDHEGLYTEMRLDNGELVRVHPENWRTP